mgnify:CR=1 FL=1
MTPEDIIIPGEEAFAEWGRNHPTEQIYNPHLQRIVEKHDDARLRLEDPEAWQIKQTRKRLAKEDAIRQQRYGIDDGRLVSSEFIDLEGNIENSIAALPTAEKRVAAISNSFPHLTIRATEDGEVLVLDPDSDEWKFFRGNAIASELLPTSAGMLAGMKAGATGGSVAGPWGTIIGGALGAALGEGEAP